MTLRAVTLLCAVGLTVAACGPSRGLRIEHVSSHARQAAAGPAGASLRIVSGTTTQGPPVALAADRSTIWVSVWGTRGSIVQPIASRTAQAGGFIEAPYRSDFPVQIATTPGRLWMLVRPFQGPAKLLGVKTQGQDAREIKNVPRMGWSPRDLRSQALAFPRTTKLAGATSSALWLTTDTAADHILWRLDTRTAALRRFELDSSGPPGVIVTPRAVYVLLRRSRASVVVIEKRNPEGGLIRQSPPVTLRGALHPDVLAACQDQIYGWTGTARGAVAFRLEAHGSGAIYSQPLPLQVNAANPPTVTAVSLDTACRNLWVATLNEAAGVVMRLRASSLAPTGTVDTAMVPAVFWAHGSLWAADLAHQAVLRIR